MSPSLTEMFASFCIFRRRVWKLRNICLGVYIRDSCLVLVCEQLDSMRKLEAEVVQSEGWPMPLSAEMRKTFI